VVVAAAVVVAVGEAAEAIKQSHSSVPPDHRRATGLLEEHKTFNSASFKNSDGGSRLLHFFHRKRSNFSRRDVFHASPSVHLRRGVLSTLSRSCILPQKLLSFLQHHWVSPA
jgi:hypothetical protein